MTDRLPENTLRLGLPSGSLQNATVGHRPLPADLSPAWIVLFEFVFEEDLLAR